VIYLVIVRVSSFVLLFVSFVLTLSLSAAQAGSAELDALLAGARCQATIRGQLEDWDGHFRAAMVEPAFPTGLRSVRLPTGAIGIWLRVVEQKPDELFVERITATRLERLHFGEGCGMSESAVALPPAAADAFSDSDLIMRVARTDRGVVLLWSPHMPLSVDQHAVLAEVARDLGLAVIPILDPAADRDYAIRVARERGLSADSTRPLGGVELALRGMATHTPSLQVFVGGQLVGPVLFGYRNATALRAALEAALAVAR
jgi:hypothetical protein